MDFDEQNAFLENAPTAGEAGDFDHRVRAWLETGGLHVTAGTGPACTIVAVMEHELGEILVFALPAEALDESAHRDLAAVSGSGFAWHFNADIEVSAYAGAFRVFGGRSDELDVFEEQVEELREEMGDDAPSMDYDALLASAGSWLPHQLKTNATLPGPVAHCYTATLAQ